MPKDLSVFIYIIIAIIIIAPSAIKVANEYERGILFRLGRVLEPRGPGIFIIIPVVDKMLKIDLRIVTLEVPPQEVITKDNVTIKVNAVVYFQVINPKNAIIQVENYYRATLQIAQTTLRSVLGQSDLDELLAQRDRINQKLQVIIDEQTEPWGIKVSIVEVKDVELPQTMQRAMAKQAEAEREKRAKVIHAEGEFSAAGTLLNAANLISKDPIAIQLRYLQTLTEIATEKNSTIVFPLPIDMMKAFFGDSREKKIEANRLSAKTSEKSEEIL